MGPLGQLERLRGLWSYKQPKTVSYLPFGHGEAMGPWGLPLAPPGTASDRDSLCQASKRDR